MEPKIIRKGWTALTPTLFQGNILNWATEDDHHNEIPDVYDTKEEVEAEIQEIIDETGDCQDYPVEIIWYDNNTFQIIDEQGQGFTMSLEEWKNNR